MKIDQAKIFPFPFFMSRQTTVLSMTVHLSAGVNLSLITSTRFSETEKKKIRMVVQQYTKAENSIKPYTISSPTNSLLLLKYVGRHTKKSIQRTQTPPSLWPLTLWCDLDLSSRSRKLMSLDVAYCIVPWYLRSRSQLKVKDHRQGRVCVFWMLLVEYEILCLWIETSNTIFYSLYLSLSVCLCVFPANPVR